MKGFCQFTAIFAILLLAGACSEDDPAAPVEGLNCPPAIMHGFPPPADTIQACFRCHVPEDGTPIIWNCPP